MASLCKCRFMLMLSRSALNAAAEAAVKQTSKEQLMSGTKGISTFIILQV